MELAILTFAAFVQLTSCWPVEEYFYLETQLQGGRVMTLSNGMVVMQHKQRLETQLWGIDETGCLRSKTSEYNCLKASETGQLSLAGANGESGQKWEMRDDGVVTSQMGKVLDVIWADVPLQSDNVQVTARDPDSTLSQKWRWTDCLFC